MKEQLWNFMSEFLGSMMNNLTIRDIAFEAMVTTLKEETTQLKMELTIHKATLTNGMLALGLKQQKMDAPKPKEFKGTMSARNVDNFHWRMEQYFHAMGIKDDAVRLLKKLFIPQYVKEEAWAKLSSLRNKLLFRTLAELKSFVELGLRKDKFETSKPKKTGNGRGGHKEEQDKNGNAGNGKNGDNG
ncbi:hypothetical protein J1N35_041602 [Gossypium stocksii]|uniref:Uncharacterized protein n=1 Tax=Gossypium stocksii TaxID=47602 RepID=A0A9D3UFT4_9ROSI|nr:hypothetical protein J1N35_041602 [Gossypium stocksii]